MQAVELIRKKRDGHSLTAVEIHWFISEYTGKAGSLAEAESNVEHAVRSGAGVAKLAEVIAAQGGQAQQNEGYVCAPTHRTISQNCRRINLSYCSAWNYL